MWLGVSVENQAAADERIPLLLKTPAAVRFLSCEPLLESLDLSGWIIPHSPERGISIFAPIIDWVIAGGESGPGARPMHPDWARSLRDQCAASDVAFFFKQWGEWGPPTQSLSDPSLHEPGSLKAYTVISSTDPKSVGKTLWRAYGPNGPELLERAGKRTSGSLLDGREHKAVPREVSRE